MAGALARQAGCGGGLDQVAEKELRAKLAVIEEGRGVALERPERVRHRLQTLLGVFDAYGVTAQQIKPVVSVGDLLSQHLDALEVEAEEKGGIAQLLYDHFSRIYKVAVPRDFFGPTTSVTGASCR
jgi:hypothetical protein